MAVDVGAVRARNAERQRQVDTGSTPAQVAGVGNRVRNTGSKSVVLNESGQPIRIIEEGKITEISQSPAAQRNSVSPPRTGAVQQGGISLQEFQRQQLIRQGVAPQTAESISRAQQLALLSPGIAGEIQRRREAGIDIPTEEALLNRRFARGRGEQQVAQNYDQYVSSPQRFVEFRENLIKNDNLTVVRGSNNGQTQTLDSSNRRAPSENNLRDIDRNNNRVSSFGLPIELATRSNRKSASLGMDNLRSNSLDPIQTFEEQIQRQQERDIKLTEGSQRVDALASFITLGGDVPASQRSYFGRAAQAGTRLLISPPVLSPEFGAGLGSAANKAFLNLKGFMQAETRATTLAESKSTILRIPSFLEKQFDVQTPEGTLNVILISATGGLARSGVRLPTGPLEGARMLLPKYERISFNIASEQGVKSINIKTLSYESQGRSLVIGAQTPEGFSIGTPKIKNPISLRSLPEAVAAPRTAGGTKVLSRLLKTSSQERVRIGAIQEQLRLSGKEKGLTVKDAFFNLRVLRNRRSSSTVIEAAIAKEQGVVFGSATTQQLPQGFRLTPGDVDVVFPRATEAQIMKGFIPDLTRNLRLQGERVRVSRENPLSIETIRGEKVIEAKSGVDPSALSGPEIANVGGLGFDFGNLRAGQVTSTVPFGKARAITAGEQLSRKGVASVFFRGPDAAAPESFRGAGVFPKGYRTKDVPDFIVQARGIAEIQKQSLNPLVRARGYRAEANIENLLKTYTPEQQRTIGEIIKVRTKDVSFNFEIKPNRSTSRNVASRSPAIVTGSPNTTVISSPRNVSSVSIRNRVSPLSPSPRGSSRVKYPSPRSPRSPTIPSPSSPSPASPSPSSPRSPSPGSPSPQSPSPPRSPSPRSPSPRSPPPRSPSPTIPYETFNPENMKFPDIKLKLDLPKPKKLKFKGPKLKKGAYLPSLKSVLFNIKGKRPSARQYETGISNRPITR